MVRALEIKVDEINVSNLSLVFLLLCIFVVFSTMSMIIFACADGTNVEEDAAKKKKKKKEEESKANRNEVTAGCCDGDCGGSCGGGGCGGGCGG
jgi:Na+-transporting methylmalonyl-CoA/oxaloacetate decarboxylase gamma subunit